MIESYICVCDMQINFNKMETVLILMLCRNRVKAE